MTKYEPLAAFLRSRDAGKQELDFEEVKTILGFDLPKSAYKHPAWWSNDETTHSQARAWLSAGWKTADLDLAGGRVTFVRHTRGNPPEPPRAADDPWGCMAGTVRVMPGVDLTAASGERWNAEAGRLLDE
jgi:hypothetical protein